MHSFNPSFSSTPVSGAIPKYFQADAPSFEGFTAAGASNAIWQLLGEQSLAQGDDLPVAAHPSGCGCMGCGLRDEDDGPDTPEGFFSADSLPVANLQTLADYLTVGYWTDPSVNWYAHGWNMTGSGSNPNSGKLLYNLDGFDLSDISWINRADSNGLAEDRKELVRDSFQLFEEVLGIDFEETTSEDTATVDFFFSDNSSGAFASTYINTGSGTSSFSFVNVNSGWSGGTSTYDDYTLQTILHEIGHALGLGHQGTYNGSGGFPDDAVYRNDSWQGSMMSYFSQTENTYIQADREFLQTPMAVDWLALQDLYGGQSHGGKTFGLQNAFNGDTTYGFNTNISASQSKIWSQFADFADRTASTIVDGSGNDTLDVSGYSAVQRIDLTPTSASMTQATTSNIGGRTGNLTLAEGTIIENAVAGSGNDEIIGNSASNVLDGNAGNDTISGFGGNDSLVGGAGEDSLDGGSGRDTLFGGNERDEIYGRDGADLIGGGKFADIVEGGDGDDELRGGQGRDTIDGGNDKDTVSGGKGADLIFGGEGGDTLSGGIGKDRLFGDDGNDVIEGNDGKDRALGLNGDDFIDGGAGADTLFGGDGKDTILGGSEDDRIDGQGGRDLLEGGSGNDTIEGFGANDVLFGGSGADELFGGRGNDLLNGGAGSDTLEGGKDRDTFQIDRDGTSVVILDFDTSDDTLDLSDLLLVDPVLSDYSSNIADGVLLAFDSGPGVSLIGLNESDLGSITTLV